MLRQERAGPRAREAGAIDVDEHERARLGRVTPLAEEDDADAAGAGIVRLATLVHGF